MMMILSSVAEETGDGFHGINCFVHGTDCFQLSWKGNEIGMETDTKKSLSSALSLSSSSSSSMAYPTREWNTSDFVGK
eukprot:scaffold9525_cov187-Ochromonas_danica.AAC.1